MGRAFTSLIALLVGLWMILDEPSITTGTLLQCSTQTEKFHNAFGPPCRVHVKLIVHLSFLPFP